MTSYRPLDEGWTLSGAGYDRVSARVPGCVHLDLMSGGHIPDPYLGDNESDLDWIGKAEWTYRTTFEWHDDGSDFVDLECDGLDTLASIELNGVGVGQTANMHRRYRFAVKELLQVGTNELSITFGSVYPYTQKWQEELGARPAAYTEPYNLVRKMACNFGWDWGPTLVTAGIWRPIGLRSWSVARLAEVRPLTTVTSGLGTVDVQVRLDGEGPLILSATIGGQAAQTEIPSGHAESSVTLTVTDPRLWWPRGYGEQARYVLEVVLSDASGKRLDSWSRPIGFRSVRLDTTPDEHGTPYTLVVNEVPVFVRGANWIPDDCFPSRITRDRLAQRLTQACQANLNYLRIWGGGLYESEEFYDLADEFGLMVGQDFLFSCAAYPEEEPFASEVLAEARDNVARLTPHPSLVLWTGNNECLWGHADWGWPDQLDGKSWGSGYYHETLPKVVAQLDPTRPYWPGSPYSGSPQLHPNDPAHGSMHIWDVWNTHDYTQYRAYTPRFVAEFGYQAPPAFATLAKGEHQKAIDGALKLQRGLDAHLPPPKDSDDYLYYTQVNQARAITLGVERFRALSPICMGAIVWQLNDCWPVTSWAAIDGDGRLKPLWYALRNAFADRLITIQPDLSVVAVNDSPDRWTSRLTVSRLGLDGSKFGEMTANLDVAPRASATVRLPADVCMPGDPKGELLVAETEGYRTFHFFAEDRELAYPAAAYQADAEPVHGGMKVTVTARTILRDLCLFPDRLDPASTVDNALVTLLAGQTTTFFVRTDQSLDPAALTCRPVLRCINDFL
ncbi:beta-mannosidase [Rhizocola hellebori]|uniref:beta-mannosidase n=1 Tax=Rhizocola hellebori TaxID=1392758 RepID=A0A8J3QAY7_9ACTN|nr:glycoside hydrolase family 2 protein [Rhizocola hellebori]GIH06260.1 beta-mannosidase [Rhizocola hellebori]